MFNRCFVTSVPSSDFTYSTDSKTFIAEMSDFKDREYLFRQKIYHDAADVGMSIRSKKTGKCEVFYYDREVLDDDGELLHVVFLPLSRDLKIAGVRVVLFND